MINILKSMNQVENCLDPQLWHACAGGMAQVPSLNSNVYYFPQGHAEHANNGNVDFGGFPRIPPLIHCKVSSIKYLADTESDEVFVKLGLIPLRGNEYDGNEDEDDDDRFLGFDKNEERDKTNSFAKTLTQSDANNGGGFSVPRYCAETIFPRLDYSAEPPVQTILAKDVHGQVWKFRHIYRGTPRRHLLTTGWSSFVNQKKLVAGDSIVFLRAENGDLCIGIRRAKSGVGGGPQVSCGWSTGAASSYASALYSGLTDCIINAKKGNGRLHLKAESVVEAVNLATRGQPFEVVYYPRASTPEFVVRESSVRAATRVQWCSGMRFKMAFETEDSSRISWFMGTISSVQIHDPIHWPNSPWRLLQVVWDEPELLNNLTRVNPWLVELVTNAPAIHLSPFSHPRKRARLPLPTILSKPPSPSSPLCCLTDIGLQGARHPRFELSSSDFQFANLRPFDFKLLDYSNPLPEFLNNHALETPKFDAPGELKNNSTPVFLLFGQPILTAEQISQSQSVDTGSNSVSDENQENVANGWEACFHCPS